MYPKQIIIVLLSGIAILGLWKLITGQHEAVIREPLKVSTPIAWKTFTHRLYGYSVSYPSDADVETENDYVGDNPIEEEQSVSFGISGDNMLFNIYVDELNFIGIDWDILKTHKLSALAQYIWEQEKANRNSTISEMKQLKLGGRTAYTFDIKILTARPQRHETEVITENKNGEKIIITYDTKDSRSLQMLASFRFTE